MKTYIVTLVTIIITVLITVGCIEVADSYATDFNFVEAYDVGRLPNCYGHLCVLYDRPNNVKCYFIEVYKGGGLSCMKIEE